MRLGSSILPTLLFFTFTVPSARSLETGFFLVGNPYAFRINLGAEFRMPFYERLSIGMLYQGRGGSYFSRHTGSSRPSLTREYISLPGPREEFVSDDDSE